MDKERLLHILENGKQIGIHKIVESDADIIAYTYAMQKTKNQYVIYIDEYSLDTAYADEMEQNTEQTFLYGNLSECLKHFCPKYDIRFEDLNVSKGQKFFNSDFVMENEFVN